MITRGSVTTENVIEHVFSASRHPDLDMISVTHAGMSNQYYPEILHSSNRMYPAAAQIYASEMPFPGQQLRPRHRTVSQPSLTPLRSRKRLKESRCPSGMEVPSETQFLRQTPKQLTGREKRFKDIEDALAGRDVPSSDLRIQTQVSTSTVTYRSRKGASKHPGCPFGNDVHFGWLKDARFNHSSPQLSVLRVLHRSHHKRKASSALPTLSVSSPLPLAQHLILWSSTASLSLLPRQLSTRTVHPVPNQKLIVTIFPKKVCIIST